MLAVYSPGDVITEDVLVPDGPTGYHYDTLPSVELEYVDYDVAELIEGRSHADERRVNGFIDESRIARSLREHREIPEGCEQGSWLCSCNNELDLRINSGHRNTSRCYASCYRQLKGEE